MNNDINSLIANYLHKNKDVNLSNVKESFEAIKENINADEKSALFDTASSKTGEEFLELMNVDQDNNSNDSYQNSVNMLLGILDANSDGELTSDEMSVLKTSSKNIVDSDDILQGLNFDETSIQYNLELLENTDEKPVSKRELPSGYKISDDGKILSSNGEEIGRVDISYSDVTGDGVADKITKYYLYNTPMENEIPKDEGRDDNVPAETPNGEDTETPSVDNTEKPSVDNTEKPVITDESVDILTEELYDATAGQLGTDEQQVETIINNDNLSSEDFVKIVASYMEKNGSLVQDIEADFSGEMQDELMNKIADKLLDAAANGSDDAIKLLCQEFYNGTAGMNGTTDEFIDRIMSTASDEVLAKIIEQYPKINEGSDIFTDIKNDFSGKVREEYLSKLNEIVVSSSKSKAEVISDDLAMTFAEQLFDATANRAGTSDDVVASILDNPDLSAEDITKIISCYDENYGSIVQAIESDFSGHDNVKYQQIIADKLVESASNGNEDAVKLLCKEFHNGTTGMLGTADEFIDRIISTSSDELLAKIVESYPDVNEGIDIFSDIKNDFSGKVRDNYLAELERSAVTVAKSKNEVISDNLALSFAKQLYEAAAGRDGTDEEKVESILNNDDLSAEDYVKIISIYNEKYGSFIQDIDGDFSGEKQDELMNKIADELIEAATNGSEDAIKILCKEFHNGTAAMSGTADEFIDRIISTANDDILVKMIENYSDVNEGSDIFTDIKNDFSGKVQDDYIDRLNSAVGLDAKSEKEVISDSLALSFAKQLYDSTENRWGTDKDTVASILENSDLTSADITKIIAVYNEQYGSFVNAIEGDFSGNDNVKYQKIIADALMSEVENDNELALQILCKEFYNATEGKNTTSDPFIEQIFNNASDKVLAKLTLMYPQVNEGSDIFDAIKGDFSGKQEDEFIKRLNDALAKYRV